MVNKGRRGKEASNKDGQSEESLSAKNMESLDFVVLFNVVVVVWVGYAASACAFMKQVGKARNFLGTEHVRAAVSRALICPVHIPVPIRRGQSLRLRCDRRIDSGRGRPPLHLN